MCVEIPFNNVHHITPMAMSSNSVLIVVDMQNDFCDPNGSLYVPGANEIIEPIKILVTNGNFDLIIFSQDWHPSNHVSFGKFPPHCVQNTWGSEIVPGLRLSGQFQQLNFQKGYLAGTDSMSVFADESGNCTGLCAKLKAMGISHVYIVGTATEYCVKATALDAVKNGFKTYVLTSMTRGINESDVLAAATELLEKDVTFL